MELKSPIGRYALEFMSFQSYLYGIEILNPKAGPLIPSVSIVPLWN